MLSACDDAPAEVVMPVYAVDPQDEPGLGSSGGDLPRDPQDLASPEPAAKVQRVEAPRRPAEKPPFELSGAAAGTPIEPVADIAWLRDVELDDDAAERGCDLGVAQLDGRIYGRLHACRDVWRKNTDDKYVLDALDNGVELPFRDGVALPPYRANRNHIAEDDKDWAREAIAELERHGAVKRWDVLRREVLAATGKDVGAHPHAVMPLIVADKSSSTPEKRMRRLIHDCRYINGFLNMEFKKFTLEQLRDFVKTLKAGDRLITIDITAAYHHVSIADRFRTFLGFEFEGVEYVYCVLPFGLSVSAYAFCKFVSVAASMIRRSGLTESLNNYMDDFVANMGESGEPAEATEVVAEVESLGFLINWVKTSTNPETRVTALGFVLDTVLMEFEVPERRLVKLKAIAQLVLESEPGVRVRDLCKLTGQIWALQPALGLVCRLKSNYITRVAMPGLRQQDYNMRVQLVGRARAEVELWASDLDHLPRMPFHKHLRIPDLVLECDASASAVAGIVVLSPGGSGIELGAIHRELSAAERAHSSCLREMLGYAHTVRTLSQRYGARLRGLVIEIVGDSKAASLCSARARARRATTRPQTSSWSSRPSWTSWAPPRPGPSRWCFAGCRGSGSWGRTR